MAYLKNENGEIIVDAILTKYGRDKIAKNGNLGITKFSLSDDEIDYSLFNISNPAGTEYYDIALRELPILEALPGDNVSMRHHLFSNTDGVVSTISQLTVQYDTSAFSGLSTLGVNYPMTPILTPLPPQSQLNSIYYVAGLTMQQYRGYVELESVIDMSLGGETSDIRTAKAMWDDRNAKELNLLQKGKITTGTISKVGHSFTLRLLTRPKSTISFTITVTAYGSISTNSVTIPVTLTATRGASNPLA